MARKKRQKQPSQQRSGQSLRRSEYTADSTPAQVLSASGQPLGGGPAAAAQRSQQHNAQADAPQYKPQNYGRPGAAYPPLVQRPQGQGSSLGLAEQPHYAGWHAQPLPTPQPRFTPAPDQAWHQPLPSLWPRTPPHNSASPPARDDSWRSQQSCAAPPPGLQQQQQQGGRSYDDAETPSMKARRKGRAASHGSHAGGHAAPAAPASLPVILFDLNGTLTSHTSARRNSGTSKLRPGLHHLHRLKAPGDSTTAPLLSSPSSQDRFQLGIFSSASALTVSRVVEMVHQAVPAAPEDPPGALFSDRALVFTRQHTQAAPQAHVEMGGKDWDTIKPLHSLPCCQGLQQVLLVDDDAFKAVDGERPNMILVPRWDDADDADMCIQHLVDALLQLVPCPTSDVRHFSGAVELQVVQSFQKHRVQPPSSSLAPDAHLNLVDEEEEMSLIYGSAVSGPLQNGHPLRNTTARVGAAF